MAPAPGEQAPLAAVSPTFPALNPKPELASAASQGRGDRACSQPGTGGSEGGKALTQGPNRFISSGEDGNPAAGRARSDRPKPSRAAGAPAGRKRGRGGCGFAPGGRPHPPVPQGRKAPAPALPGLQPAGWAPRGPGSARSRPGRAAGRCPPKGGGLGGGASHPPGPAVRALTPSTGAGPAPPLTERHAPRQRRLTY